MSFSQSAITVINPPVQSGTELLISWTSSAPVGTVFQVYVDQQLVWSGVGLSCAIPLPTAPVARIDVGTVGAGEAQVSFAAGLPLAPNRRVTLSWLGGTYQAADIAGFHIYGEASPGSGINYAATLATIPAYIAGIVTDGFGYGGYGLGGFGESAASYSWTTQPLSGGTWNWAIKPYDTAGNEGAASTVAVAIASPPIEPAPFSDNARLHYTYAQPSNEITLSWNPSPG
jgi:hypothetical protein